AIHCQPRPCTVGVDGAIAAAETKEDHVLYLDPDEHAITASFGTLKSDPQTVLGAAGDDKTLTFDAPPEPPPQAAAGEQAVAGTTEDTGVQADEGGLPPWVFIASTAVTMALGATA